MPYAGETAASRLRASLGHPVIDADGHLIEPAPVFKGYLHEFVAEHGGGDLAERFARAGGMDYDDMVLRPWSAMSEADRRKAWVTRPPWWSLPAQTLDRATAHLPRLMYERLDDLGLQQYQHVAAAEESDESDATLDTGDVIEGDDPTDDDPPTDSLGKPMPESEEPVDTGVTPAGVPAPWETALAGEKFSWDESARAIVREIAALLDVAPA